MSSWTTLNPNYRSCSALLQLHISIWRMWAGDAARQVTSGWLTRRWNTDTERNIINIYILYIFSQLPPSQLSQAVSSNIFFICIFLLSYLRKYLNNLPSQEGQHCSPDSPPSGDEYWGLLCPSTAQYIWLLRTAAVQHRVNSFHNSVC